MAHGIDTAQNCEEVAHCLKEQGIAFVGRYYNSNNKAKNLTRAEALALSAGNLYVVTIWENGFPTGPDYFTDERGSFDGAGACRIAADVVGQPEGTPIYFAVDYDASTAQVESQISSYFSAIEEAVRATKGGSGAPAYSIGVYGSGLVCGWLLDNMPSVRYAWLAQSRGWRGTAEFDRWNIRQGPERTICGLDADVDETVGNGGGWVLATTPFTAAKEPSGN